MLIYRSADGSIKIDVRMGEETVWLTQDQMAALFGKAKSTINEHLKNIFSEGELVADSVIRNFRTTAADGKGYDTNYYNLDVIISVGYRVKSHQGTQFRIWATQVLREYLIKGFALNDERMKSGKSMNYFDELQERIREIRLSKRVFYQKVKDIYTTSIDYDPKAEKTVEFFKIVQNKLLWAISSQTAAELIAHRADARLPMMGMTSCDKSDPRRITKADAATAKNYLTEDEMKDLGLLVEQYLAFAESQARRQVPMYMADWIKKLNDILVINGRELLEHAGQISRKVARKHRGPTARCLQGAFARKGAPREPRRTRSRPASRGQETAMTRIEYIRLSHRHTNRKIRERLQAVRTRLDAKSRWLGGAWQAVAWVLYSIVSVVSWLAFAAEMFKDNRFSLHYMECEIEHRNLSAAEARQYIADKKQEYDRWLAYGSISAKEQRRIDKTFEYLSARYPADTPADELLNRIAEVRTTVTEIADYTRHRQTEEVQRKEREAELLAQAEKRRAAQRSRTGFDPIPADFCPRLTDWQIAVLTKHINRIGIFKRDTTEEEIARLLACQLAEPLQTTHNKLLALLLESLSASRLITPKWQRVAGNNGCFTSKLGKPLTAKDLSAAKQMAEIIDRRKERMIIDCIEALEAAE